MLTAEITSYNQKDKQWVTQRLGTVNGSTIGVYGCYISVYADIATYFGHKITPADLDNLFTDNHWYYNSQNNHNDPANLLADADLSKAYPDIKYLQTYHYENDPADLKKLQELLSDPSIAVGLELDFDHDPNDGIQMHFVEAISCDGKTVEIADPWFGSIDDIQKNYGTDVARVIQKFVVYQGPAPKGSGGLPDNYNDIVHGSTQWDATVAEYLKDLKPANATFTDLKAKIDVIKKQADDAIESANKAHQALSDYRKAHPDNPISPTGPTGTTTVPTADGSTGPTAPATTQEPATPAPQPNQGVDPQLSTNPASTNATQTSWQKFLQYIKDFFS